MSKTTILFTHHTFLTAIARWEVLCEHTRANFPLSFLTWMHSLKIQLQENWPLYSDKLSKANLLP